MMKDKYGDKLARMAEEVVRKYQEGLREAMKSLVPVEYANARSQVEESLRFDELELRLLMGF